MENEKDLSYLNKLINKLIRLPDIDNECVYDYDYDNFTLIYEINTKNKKNVRLTVKSYHIEEKNRIMLKKDRNIFMPYKLRSYNFEEYFGNLKHNNQKKLIAAIEEYIVRNS